MRACRPAYECLSFLLREEGRPYVTAANFDFCQSTLLGFVDSVLDPSIARQHVLHDFAAPDGGTRPSASPVINPAQVLAAPHARTHARTHPFDLGRQRARLTRKRESGRRCRHGSGRRVPTLCS